MSTFFFVLWYFLPAGLANTAPIFAGHLQFLKQFNYPLDGYLKFKGKRILGDHKTIRGIIAGIIVGIVVSWMEVWLYREFKGIREVITLDYNQLNPFLLGSLAGLGALGGDIVKSFFKRQLSIPSGKSWFPFDQIDYIIGGCLLMSLYMPLSFYQYTLLFILWFVLHPVSTYIGYILHLKEKPI